MNAIATTLRPMTEADYPFVEALYASTRAEEMAQVPWPPDAIQAFLADQCRLQHLHYATRYKDTSFDLVLVEGEPVGRLYVARWPKEIRVVDISLLPTYRGCGIGRSLMAAVMAEADRTALPLILHMEQFNPALAWYQRLGFKAVDTSGVYFRMVRAPLPMEAAR